MTEQEIFDKALRHIRLQAEPCMSLSVCRYRHENLRCAIGTLIPDDLYVEDIEHVTLRELNAFLQQRGAEAVFEHVADPSLTDLARAELYGILTVAHLIEHIDLLCELQNAHDTGVRQYRDEDQQREHNKVWLREWEDNMRSIAEQRGLTYA